jgi:FkbM family methyltransferase
MLTGYKDNRTLNIWLNIIHKLAFWLFHTVTYFQKHRRKLSYLISKILPPLNKDMICPTVFDFKLCLNQNGGHWIYYLGFYELGTLDVIRQCLKEGDTFIDVGSSIGLMTLTASKAVGEKGQVFSFEPDKKRFINLSNSISINNSQNIKTFNYALGSADKEIFLNSNLPTPRISKTNSDNVTRVKSKTIDTLVKEECIQKISFIKIDVEGYELEVLKGAKQLLSSIEAPILCIECNTSLKEIKKSDILLIFEFIKNCNSSFLFFQLSKTSHVISKMKRINSFEELNTNDNLYCFLPKHITQVKTGRTFGEIDDRSSTFFTFSTN